MVTYTPEDCGRLGGARIPYIYGLLTAASKTVTKSVFLRMNDILHYILLIKIKILTLLIQPVTTSGFYPIIEEDILPLRAILSRAAINDYFHDQLLC